MTDQFKFTLFKQSKLHEFEFERNNPSNGYTPNRKQKFG